MKNWPLYLSPVEKAGFLSILLLKFPVGKGNIRGHKMKILDPAVKSKIKKKKTGTDKRYFVVIDRF